MKHILLSLLFAATALPAYGQTNRDDVVDFGEATPLVIKSADGEHKFTVEEAKKVVNQIRPGSILLTVREDRPWVPIWVTHVGIVIVTEDGPKVRHATKMGSGGTRDHDLNWYLDHIATYSNWKTLGVSILEPIEPGPRLSRLLE